MNVIICDDYQLIVKSLIRDIQQIDAQAECHGFTDATEALEYIRSNPVDAALLDIDMPDIDGLMLGRAILERYPRTNIIFVTGHPEFALEAHELYASSFLVKPVTLEALRNAFSHFRYPVAGAFRQNTSDFYNGKSVFGKKYPKP